MPERTLDEAYEALLQSMRDQGLGWVVEQVQQQVRAGKLVTKDVTPFRESYSSRFIEELAVGTRRRRRERLAATEEYSAEERLSLVLEAIENAVVHTAEIQDQVLQFVQDQSSIDQVRFEPDAFEEAQAFTLSADDRRRPQVEMLREALARLRMEVRPDADHG